MMLDRALQLVKRWEERKKVQITDATQPTQDTSVRLFEVMKNNHWWSWINTTTRLYTNASSIVCAGPGLAHQHMSVVPAPQMYALCGSKYRMIEGYKLYHEEFRHQNCTRVTCNATGQCKATIKTQGDCTALSCKLLNRCALIDTMCPAKCQAYRANSNYPERPLQDTCKFSSVQWSYMPNTTSP